MSLSARGEYVHGTRNYQYSYAGYGAYGYNDKGDAWALTGTLQYDLWANVISRLEVRYDKVNTAVGLVSREESLGLYANIIYKF